MLAKFKNKLHSVKEEDAEAKDKTKDDEDDDDENVEGDSWMRHSLKFDNNDPVLAKDASTKDDDWFDIYDPRDGRTDKAGDELPVKNALQMHYKRQPV